MIRRDLRQVVAAFYRVARDSDDVADHPVLSVEEKLAGLDRFEAGLDGDSSGAPQALALRAHGRSEFVRHARQLLRAFRKDARNQACRTWGDLLDYCEDSANPVGRFLLDLHGEAREVWPLADRLCTALQILNHLQDLKADHLRLGRHYLPLEWMAEEGVPLSDLEGAALSPALRRCVDRALDLCDEILQGARGLPAALGSRRLAGESATILWLARRLSARLRAEDPLAGRVKLSRLDFARAGLLGLRTAIGPPPAARAMREEEA